MEPVEIVIVGHSEPGGSKTHIPLKRGGAYVHGQGGRPIVQVVDANPRVAGWKKKVSKQAIEQFTGDLLTGPLIVGMDFYVHRFKSHYGTGANAKILKDSAPTYPTGPPDALKLARPVEDALTGVVWEDDSQTVDLISRKRYVDHYCVKLGKGDYMPGEFVRIKILQHDYATVGERAAAMQGQLLAV